MKGNEHVVMGDEFLPSSILQATGCQVVPDGGEARQDVLIDARHRTTEQATTMGRDHELRGDHVRGTVGEYQSRLTWLEFTRAGGDTCGRLEYSNK